MRDVVVRRNPPPEVTGENFRQWVWECGRKVMYGSRSIAKRFAKHRNLHRVYKCSFGPHWHLTSQPKPKMKAVR